MTLYEIIRNFLLTLFPSEINAQCLAFVNLLSLVGIALLFYVAICFIKWCFDIVAHAFVR